MVKKVVFVEPRGTNANVYAKFMNIPLLGPIYLGTIAKQNGYDVSVLNENILGRDVTQEELRSADILGVSCISATVNRGKEIARAYKSARREAGLESRAVIGGIHASMMPGDVKDDFDQVAVGECEEVILDILSGKRAEKIVEGGRPTELDRIPIPDFSIIKEGEKIDIIPVMTSRGCPYNCNFCSVTEMFGRKYRAQSPERVLEEIVAHETHASGSGGGKRIFFVDDHFAADMKRSNALMDMMKYMGFSLNWSAQVRTEVTKRPEFVRKMKEAGCDTVYVGFESINPETLKDMNKGQEVRDIERSIRVFHDNGINVHGMFMLGGDTDTRDVFPRTSEFCIGNKVDYVQYSVITPLPGTSFYRNIERQKRLLHKKWDYYEGMHVVFEPLKMTAAELQKGMISCYKDFYSYRHALADAFGRIVDATKTTMKRLYTNANFRSPFPIIMKIGGREIVNRWVENNRHYLDYLAGFKPLKP